MKVFLHIATEYEFMDGEVQVAVECSAAPRIGDTFHPAEKDIIELEKTWTDIKADGWVEYVRSKNNVNQVLNFFKLHQGLR